MSRQVELRSLWDLAEGRAALTRDATGVAVRTAREDLTVDIWELDWA